MSTLPVKRVFKVVLIGDGGVGKTVFVNRHNTGEFEQNYVPTLGVEVTPLVFETNKGNYTLNVWDCAGQEKFAGLQSGYYIGANAVLFFFDLTSETSYKNLTEWYKKFKRVVLEDVPMVLCANKCDCSELMDYSDVTFHRKKGMSCYQVSANSNYNFEKPFIDVLRKLTNDNGLYFL